MHLPAMSHLKILIGDDDAGIAWSIAAALKSSMHCAVRMAEDGAQALDMAIDMRPDVILMDIDMPGVGGIEAASLLRRLFGVRDVPRLLAVSGYCGGHARKMLLRSGFDDYLQTPVSLEALCGALGQAVAAS